MKMRILALMLAVVTVVLSLSGCGEDPMAKYKDLPDTYNVETDFPIGFSSSALGNMVAGDPVPNRHAVTRSDTGYYFSTYDFIYYFDRETQETVPLCIHPECMHQNDTTPRYWQCDAYFWCGCLFVQYYEDSLYVICYNYTVDGKHVLAGGGNYQTAPLFLVKVSKDGTEKEALTLLDAATYAKYFIHRGYLYILQTATYEEEKPLQLLRVPLSTPRAEPEVLIEFENRMTFTGAFFYGNHFYYSTSQKSDDFFGRVFDLDLNTGKVKEIGGKIEGDTRRLAITGIYQDKLLVQAYLHEQGEQYELCDQYLLDRRTGEAELLCDLKEYTPEWGAAYLCSSGEDLSYYITDGSSMTFAEIDESYKPTGASGTIKMNGIRENFYLGDDDHAFYFDGETLDWKVIDKQNGCEVKTIHEGVIPPNSIELDEDEELIIRFD